MDEILKVGPLVIQAKWLIAIITYICISYVIHILLKKENKDSFNLYTDLISSIALILIFTWKFSYPLFNFSSFLAQPISGLYLNGGLSGWILGGIFSVLYCVITFRKKNLQLKRVIDVLLLHVLIFIPTYYLLYYIWLLEVKHVSIYISVIGYIIFAMYLSIRTQIFKGEYSVKKWIGALVLVGLIGYLLFNSVFTEKEVSKPDGKVGTKVGNIAPDFTLPTLTGDAIKLSDIRGKKVIINFWATWCPPCKAEMPDIQKFYEKNKDEVAVVSVNITRYERNKDHVPTFVDEYGLTFPVLLDEKAEVSEDKYNVLTIPTTYFLDTKGFIREKIAGPITYEKMEQIIKSMK